MTKHCTLHYCYCGRGLSVGPSVAPPGPTLGREVVLECTHGLVSSCSYSYVTKFTPSQEERCSGPPRRHSILTIHHCICRDLLQAVPDRVREGGELGGGGALLPARHQAVSGQPPARGRGPGGRGNLLQSEYTL